MSLRNDLALSSPDSSLSQSFESIASCPMGDTSRGSQPLHFAALCLSANCITVLLRAGAPTEAVCSEVFVGPERMRNALTNCKVGFLPPIECVAADTSCP